MNGMRSRMFERVWGDPPTFKHPMISRQLRKSHKKIVHNKDEPFRGLAYE